MFSDRLDAMQSMVERLPGVADTPFTDDITLIEMPRKFSFPSIKAYNGTTDPDNHVAQYRQRMLTVALPKGSREARTGSCPMAEYYTTVLLGKNTQVSNTSRLQAGHWPLDPRWKEPRFPGSLLEGTPGSPLWSFPGPVPGSPLSPGNGKLPIRRTFHISEYGRV
ncbi:hypothetical protein DY000_02052856 [Brassica cretica]|uniref:Uncharacterized protein n=1 Tax=Brassica cretica TaxID=69181 RepID=A0ABQ7AI10_BRACR|nr:hypothetical protein DY000_02052856 [Brassica cretica]